MRAIYNRSIDVRTEIERHIFDETLRLFNEAAAKGLAQSYDPTLVTDGFLDQVRRGNAVFSAFRTHRMQNDLASRLLDPQTGRLKGFERWREDVRGMTDNYCRAWLKTEYDTALIRASRASDWAKFEAEKDLYPNVRWMPTTSAVPDPLHARYWEMKLTLPVDHPFWQEHRPGDRWNCKCRLRNTADPVNASALDGWTPPLPMPGLDNNPAEDGRMFSETHPYYTEAYPGAAKAAVKAVSSIIPEKQQKQVERDISQLQGGIGEAIARLQQLEGADFWKQLKKLTERGEFKRVTKDVFSAAGKADKDYPRLLEAAKKTTTLGYRAFILPNPRGTKSADLIVERKGVYKLYDVKTVSGKGSVSSRLVEGAEQSRRIILNFRTDYDPRQLSNAIERAFNAEPPIREILLLYKKKSLLITSNGFKKDGQMRWRLNELFR